MPAARRSSRPRTNARRKRVALVCAGGGVINCGPPWKMKRVNGNKVKAQQLFDAKSRGAETCVAPCHNCHGGLEDIIHHNEIGMDLKFLGDIIYEVMEKPESVL